MLPGSGPASGPWWRTRAVGVIALGLALGLLGTMAVLGTLWLFGRPLALLVAAAVLAASVDPPVRSLARRWPRGLAIITVHGLVLLAIGGIGLIVTLPLLAQSEHLLEAAPGLIATGQDALRQWNPVIADAVLDSVSTWAAGLAQHALAVPLILASGLFEALLVAVMAMYWALATPALRQLTMSLFPVRYRTEVASITAEMGATMGGYFRAAAIDALVFGAVLSAALFLLGVQLPLVLGLFAALSKLIPLVGRWIGGIPAVAFALIASPLLGLAVLVIYLLLDQLECYWLKPKLAQDQAEIPPLLVIFALLAGVTAGGILGALVAVPLAGSLRILFMRIMLPAVRRWSGAARPEASPPQTAARSAADTSTSVR
jgi:predicted PurR-regulated permease PerM